MKWLMLEWSKTGSSMVRKQNYLWAVFSVMAEHSRRRDAMLYSEQIRSALTITSGWMDRWPPEVRTVAVFQGRHQLGKVQSLIDPDQQVIGIDEIPQLLVVNWNRVESLRDRSRGSIIGGLGYNADRFNKPNHRKNMRTNHWN